MIIKPALLTKIHNYRAKPGTAPVLKLYRAKPGTAPVLKLCTFFLAS